MKMTFHCPNYGKKKKKRHQMTAAVIRRLEWKVCLYRISVHQLPKVCGMGTQLRDGMM